MEMVRTHNWMAVKRGYLMFFIILMPHDRNFIRYLSSTRHRVVCRIDVLPYIGAFMRNAVFLSRPSTGLVQQDERFTDDLSGGVIRTCLIDCQWMQMRLRSTAFP
jgi:hypothetical protein